jgi:hypothetical protein
MRRTRRHTRQKWREHAIRKQQVVGSTPTTGSSTEKRNPKGFRFPLFAPRTVSRTVFSILACILGLLGRRAQPARHRCYRFALVVLVAVGIDLLGHSH